MKFSYKAFVELTQRVVGYFYKHFSYKKWHGLRLLAVDGSTVKVPTTKEVVDHFGVVDSANGEPCPLARISLVFDVQNRIITDAVISPKENGERSLAVPPIKGSGPKDLFLLDRGYPAFWLFVLILSKGGNFCARVTTTHWKVIKKFFNSGKKEQFVYLSPSAASVAMCRKLGLPLAPIKVRLVRIDLGNGEAEILITSLMDQEKYPYEVFEELYHHRWPVEEEYKSLKCRVQIDNFTGKSVESVYQDFHARIFTANLTAILAHPVQRQIDDLDVKKKYRHQINLTQALSKMKDTVVLLFCRSNIGEILEKLLTLFLKTTEPIRPGRKNPRKMAIKRKTHHFAYKPIR